MAAEMIEDLEVCEKSPKIVHMLFISKQQKGAGHNNNDNIVENLVVTPCNLNHDNHYNYTNVIDDPKDCTESTV
eukprot:8958667-Ditylum_brightwellii.AAC.1